MLAWGILWIRSHRLSSYLTTLWLGNCFVRPGEFLSRLTMDANSLSTSLDGGGSCWHEKFSDSDHIWNRTNQTQLSTCLIKWYLMQCKQPNISLITAGQPCTPGRRLLQTRIEIWLNHDRVSRLVWSFPAKVKLVGRLHYNLTDLVWHHAVSWLSLRLGLVCWDDLQYHCQEVAPVDDPTNLSVRQK